MGKIPGERTPLLTTVRVGAAPPRYSHHTVRRFCTIALGSSLIALFLTFLWTVVFRPSHHVDFPSPHHGSHISFDELKAILLGTPNEDKAAEWSKYYTSGPHLAGKNLSQVCRPRFFTM
jgi:N-acetylated-alpha-linked acidic dipeptidase